MLCALMPYRRRLWRADCSILRWTGAALSDYQVPLEKSMSAMTALDYIYQNLDGTISYYDHAACDLGICARCTGMINGKPGLFCQTVIQGDVILEPTSKDRVLKDLVAKKP
jgi:succinate dehydrogenase/fumarate reductase-like Fe-S protein